MPIERKSQAMTVHFWPRRTQRLSPRRRSIVPIAKANGTVSPA